MDIQYIPYAFSCVVYIISYIGKAKRELGLLLQQTKMKLLREIVMLKKRWEKFEQLIYIIEK